ncbi:MAG: MlaD family protein [Steroidobacteraceae bacterium]|jgi:phospholipid/cholesterol/gamma-HCH transport system substrate-binding protein|nr:MCE family protein [Steroidobacteraceae bacterium]
MEREANYAAVGAFVLLVVAMAVLFVYWYSDSVDRRDYTRYEIYFDGSVSGLSRGSPVRYLGVDVGRVVTMRVDRRSSARVQVIADIDSEAPISGRTVAQLSLQGVTGLLYIDLVESHGNLKTITPVPSERYPVIASARSGFDLFLASLPEVVAKANEVLNRVNTVLSDTNIAALTKTLASLEGAAARLPGTMQDAGAVVADLRASARDFGATMVALRALSEKSGPDVSEALARMRVAAEHIATASAGLDRFIAENERELRGFARDGLPEIEQLLQDARSAATEFRDLSRSLRENPGQLVYESNYFGVEIPR